MSINVNNLVKVGQLQTNLTRVKSELDGLDARNFGDVSIADGKIKFFAAGGSQSVLNSTKLRNLKKSRYALICGSTGSS